MSNSNKHIDRIFQESFKEFEAKPADDVWYTIQKKLHPTSKKVVPIWWKTAGIAAALLLAFGLGYFLQPKNKLATPLFSSMIDKNANTQDEENWSNRFENANKKLKNLTDKSYFSNFNLPLIYQAYPATIAASPTQNKSTDSKAIIQNANFNNNEFLLNNDDENAKTEISNLATNNSILNNAFSDWINNITPTEIVDSPPNLADFGTNNKEQGGNQFDVFFDHDIANEIASSSAQNWFLKPVISPIFNAGNNASASLGQEVANNASSGDVSFSFGVQVGFKLTNKWSIRSGINQINTSYTTSDVVYAPSAAGFMPEGVNSAYGLYGANFYTTNLSSESGRLFSQQGNLNQQINFLEVPLEMQYQLLEGKFGIHLTGGASTLFVTGNSLILNTTTGNENIGEANNLNSTSFSTNLGLGLHYRLTRKLKLNVEPALKYQINTFEGSDLNFNPYFFGIYSGLQFQF